MGSSVPIGQWLTDAGIPHTNLGVPGYKDRVFEPELIVVHYPVGIDDDGGDSILHLVAYQGSSAAPAPIYHLYVDHADGSLFLVTEGRANHAGSGSLTQLLRARQDLPVVAPDDLTGDTIIGNQYSIGISLEGPPTTDTQRDTAARACAAICTANGWTANRVLGHSEWTWRKTDPDFDMHTFRQQVEEHMAALTPEQETLLTKLGGLVATLEGFGWDFDGDNAGKRIEYANRLRNGLAARTGVSGDNGDGIAAKLALLDDLAAAGITADEVRAIIAASTIHPPS